MAAKEQEQALASVESEQANLLAAQHKLQQDEAIRDRAERDRVRYQGLIEKHEISRSDYDGRQTDAVAATQALEADRAAVTSIEQKITEARSLVDECRHIGIIDQQMGRNGPRRSGNHGNLGSVSVL
jgi:membrane fusion protein (multidrug efflux system)